MERRYEAVVARLVMLGYTVTEADKASLDFLTAKCEQEILDNINHKRLPRELEFTLVDMVAGQFLFDKKAAGGLTGVEGFDFSAPAKSITEGDVKVDFGGQSEGSLSPEARFDALLDSLRRPSESILGAYRRMRW